MGGGTWCNTAYVSHSTTSRGYATMDDFYKATTQDLYKSKTLEAELNPYNVMRECRDSNEHPNTIPVILALDVTGSMGSAANAVAKQLGDIMSKLYDSVTDIEFCVMAIGDLAYDKFPIQMSQFESDIRIAENLEKVYFERGGGGNDYESYTSAWYMGLKHTDLDCWKRGKRGIIITMGDEKLNPYLPSEQLNKKVGDTNQNQYIETSELYQEVIKKFDVYHISIDDPNTSYAGTKTFVDKSWEDVLGEHYYVSTNQKLTNTIVDIINKAINNTNNEFIASQVNVDESGFITWD